MSFVVSFLSFNLLSSFSFLLAYHYSSAEVYRIYGEEYARGRLTERIVPFAYKSNICLTLHSFRLRSNQRDSLIFDEMSERKSVSFQESTMVHPAPLSCVSVCLCSWLLCQRPDVIPVSVRVDIHPHIFLFFFLPSFFIPFSFFRRWLRGGGGKLGFNLLTFNF